MGKRQILLELKNKKKTLAVAESCTGGLISHKITNVPGSSEYFLGGIIAYSNGVKIKVLGVPRETIKKYGAVSCQTALSMAEGIRRLLKSDIAASVTGIAGPQGGSKKKPKGIVYIALVDVKREKVYKKLFKGSRQSIKNQAANAVLQALSTWQI